MPNVQHSAPQPLHYATPRPKRGRASLNAGVHACLFTLVALLNVAVLVIYVSRILEEGSVGVFIAIFLTGFAFVMSVRSIRAWHYVGLLNRLNRESAQR